MAKSIQTYKQDVQNIAAGSTYQILQEKSWIRVVRRRPVAEPTQKRRSSLLQRNWNRNLASEGGFG